MSARLPSLNGLRVFEAAARLGSFKQAALELHLTQSAVSRRIRALELELGKELFRRGHRRVDLTEAGEALATTMGRALADIVETIRRLALGSRPRPAQVLVIATTPGIADGWLAARLAAFCRAHHEVEPEVSVMSDTLAEIEAGRADVAIHWGSGSWPHLVHDVLMEVTEFPVCSPALLAHGPPLACAADLAGHRLLHRQSRRFWADWLRDVGARRVDWRRGPVLRDYTLCMELASGGEGVAIGDELIAGDRVLAGRLVKPLAEARIHPHRMHLLARPDCDAGNAAAIDAFRVWLRAEIRAHVARTAILREAAPYARAGGAAP